MARNGVTGCYSAVINGYVELLKTGAYLAGLTPHKKDHTRFEGRVEHASPDIKPDEVLEAVELLRANAAGLIASAVVWLGRHGLAPTAENALRPA